MIAYYILLGSLIVYGGCVTGAFIASERNRLNEQRRLITKNREVVKESYHAGLEDGRDEVIWQLVDVLEISTIGTVDRDKCHRDLSVALNRRKEENHAERRSSAGAAGR